MIDQAWSLGDDFPDCISSSFQRSVRWNSSKNFKLKQLRPWWILVGNQGWELMMLVWFLDPDGLVDLCALSCCPEDLLVSHHTLPLWISGFSWFLQKLRIGFMGLACFDGEKIHLFELRFQANHREFEAKKREAGTGTGTVGAHAGKGWKTWPFDRLCHWCWCLSTWTQSILQVSLPPYLSLCVPGIKFYLFIFF